MSKSFKHQVCNPVSRARPSAEALSSTGLASYDIDTHCADADICCLSEMLGAVRCFRQQYSRRDGAPDRPSNTVLLTIELSAGSSNNLGTFKPTKPDDWCLLSVPDEIRHSGTFSRSSCMVGFNRSHCGVFHKKVMSSGCRYIFFGVCFVLFLPTPILISILPSVTTTLFQTLHLNQLQS